MLSGVPMIVAAAVVTVVATGPEGGSVPFSLRDSSDIVVPVTIAGRGPFEFLLDTGSSRSAISERLVWMLGLPGIGKTSVVTPAGRKARILVHAVVGLGPARKALAATVLLSDDLRGGLDGVIGSDLLATHRFMIDYVGRCVSFGVSDPLESASFMLQTDADNRFLATVPGDGAQPSLRLIPDSGAAGFVLFDRPGRQLPRITPLAPVPVQSLGGLKVGRAVLLEQLQLGDIQLRDQIAVLLRGPNMDDGLGDGLLPLHLFAQVSFDAAGGSLTIVPRK